MASSQRSRVKIRPADVTGTATAPKASGTRPADPLGGPVRGVPGLLGDMSPLRRSADLADPLGGTAVPADVGEALRRRRGAGVPLPEKLAGTFGEHLGQDLSGVRVHSDGESGRIAQSLQSTAFTHGADVYFAPGAYRPGSEQGQRLIAHELGHVVAQRTGTDAGGGGPLSVGAANDPAEGAADRVADGAMAALRRSPAAGTAGECDAGPGIRRSPAPAGPGGVPAADQVRRTPVPAVLRRKGGLFSKKKDTAPSDSGGDGGGGVVKAAGFGLSREARDAFAAATKARNDYADFQAMTESWVTQDQQKKIADVGGKSKGKADKRAVKDLLRAYLMAEFVGIVEEKLANSKTPSGDWAEPTSEERKRIDTRYFPRTLQNRDMYAGLIEKGPYAPETITWLRMAGFDSVITKSDDELADEAEGPRIDVRSTFIGGTILGMRQRMHLFIVYTSEDGRQTYFRGGPGEDGNTAADVGDYEPDTVDWDPSAPSVTAIKGDAAKSKLDGMIEAAARVNSLGVPYSGVDVKLNKGGLGGLEAIVSGENCNSTAWTILDRAGVPKKKPSGLHPGWGHVLGDLKGQGAQQMPGKEATSGDAALIKGKPTDLVPVYADRNRIEKMGTVAGGTAVEHIQVPDDTAGLAKIKFGPDNKIGWVSESSVGAPPKPRKAGRMFWVKGNANQMIPMFDANGGPVHADGQNPIEVLDDGFVIGKGGMVRVRYSDKYVAEFEGKIDANYLSDQDPKVVVRDDKPKAIPKVVPVDDSDSDSGEEDFGERREGLEPVTFRDMIPLYNADGSRHEYRGVQGGPGRKVIPTGRTTKVNGKQMVEFEVVDPYVVAWMPAGEWARLTGKPYPA